MTQEQINRACAQLDGWEYVGGIGMVKDLHLKSSSDKQFQYTTSYDAIIPLIQRLPQEPRKAVSLAVLMDVCPTVFSVIEATPLQLCEALLRAVGKWEE